MKEQQIAYAIRQDTLMPDLYKELTRLTELSTKYPEIGPLIAEIAIKTGYPEISERILSMGLEGDLQGIEYHIVAARLARRSSRSGRVYGELGEIGHDSLFQPLCRAF